MVSVKLKRPPEQSVTQLEDASTSVKRLRLISSTEDVAELVTSLMNCSDVVTARALIRKLSRRQSQTPSLSDKLLHCMKDTMATASEMLLPELWQLANDCFSTVVAEDVLKRFIALAQSQLKNNSPVVRKAVITFLGDHMATCDSNGCIMEMVADQDGRIRLAALKAMLKLYERGAKLTLELYTKSLQLSTDTSEHVRRFNLQIIAAIAAQDGEVEVHARGLVGHDKIRLVDDAFAWTCEALNDPSQQVRRTAAQLMGSYSKVSIPFLMQTLEKNLMSNLNKVRSFNERAKGENFNTEFSSGRKFEADKAVRGEVEDDNNVISRGACGAFIHGLEDEFRQVRLAAVDSLCELASKETSGQFAKQSMDYLVDMLNDEIEEVRLNAVTSCKKLASKVPVLLEDQLENVLTSCLPDARADIRFSTHGLLAACRLLSRNCLERTIRELLKSLEKYPDDRNSIFEAFRDLGSHHPHFVSALTPKLLEVHPFFDTKETDISDAAYAAKLIMILNGAKNNPSVSQFFPPFTIRHYSYLRDVFPLLVPKLIFLENRSATEIKTDNDIDEMKYLRERLNDIKSTNSLLALKSALDSLRRMASVSLPRHVQSAVNIHREFLELQSMLRADAFHRHPIRKCLSLAKRLLTIYVGLGSSEILRINELKFRCMATLFYHQGEDKEVSVNISHLRSMMENISSILAKDEKLESDKFTSTVLRECRNVNRESLFHALLGGLLNDSEFGQIRLRTIESEHIEQISAKITSPEDHAGHRPSYNWVICIGHMAKFKATLYTPRNPDENLVFRVRYGIAKDELFFLNSTHLRRTGHNEYEVERQIELTSRIVWPAAVRVDVELCWTFNQQCFLGESQQNPRNGLITLDKISLDCFARQPNGSVSLE